MVVFRIQKAKRGLTLSGDGAARMGGRWNSTGTGIIYTAANRSLAMAEVAVHISIGTMPSGYHILEIHIPDNASMLVVQEKDLPANWDTNPPPLTTKKVGDDFIKENRYCLLKIPSSVTKGDFNILINPAHPEFVNIKIISADPFPFDMRLFNRP